MSFESLLDSSAAASMLGIHPKTLIRLARERRVPALRIGKLWKFRGSQLDSWVTSQAQSFGQSVPGAQEIP